CLCKTSILVWKPSVMPLFLVNRHNGRDLLPPGMQGVAELNHLRQLLLSQEGDHPQQLRRQFPALVLIQPFVQKQITKLLFEPVTTSSAGFSLRYWESRACCSGFR